MSHNGFCVSLRHKEDCNRGNGCNPNCPLNSIQISQVQQLINNASVFSTLGAPGTPGSHGATGAAGATGATGAQGAAGTPGSGAAIPYSSGIPMALTALLGIAGTVGLPGFGNSGTIVSLFGAPIDLGTAGGPGLLIDTAFNINRPRIITGISGTFSVVVGLALPIGSIDIIVQLYSAPINNNLFNIIPGASLLLTPSLSGLIIPPGTIASGSSGLINIPVAADTRLLMVVFAVGSGFTAVTTVVGYFSGGVDLL